MITPSAFCRCRPNGGPMSASSPRTEKLDHRGDLTAGTAAETDASCRGVLPVPADRRRRLVTGAAAHVVVRHLGLLHESNLIYTRYRRWSQPDIADIYGSGSGGSRSGRPGRRSNAAARRSHEASAWLTTCAAPADLLNTAADCRLRPGASSFAASMISREPAWSISAPRLSTSGWSTPSWRRVRSTGPGRSSASRSVPAPAWPFGTLYFSWAPTWR